MPDYEEMSILRIHKQENAYQGTLYINAFDKSAMALVLQMLDAVRL